jgi:hypothetical protein
MKLYDNPAALERLFVPTQVLQRKTDADQRDAVLSLADFARNGIVGGEESGKWIANGRAEVRIHSYRPEKVEVSVDAAESAVIGTSIPRWPGWKLAIDGRSGELLAYNRAFLGFAVPAGRHEVVLRYRPDGFVAGGIVTGATIAGCVLTALVRRRRRTPAPAAP